MKMNRRDGALYRNDDISLMTADTTIQWMKEEEYIRDGSYL
jgi:hypothetical protein